MKVYVSGREWGTERGDRRVGGGCNTQTHTHREREREREREINIFVLDDFIMINVH